MGCRGWDLTRPISRNSRSKSADPCANHFHSIAIPRLERLPIAIFSPKIRTEKKKCQFSILGTMVLTVTNFWEKGCSHLDFHSFEIGSRESSLGFHSRGQSCHISMSRKCLDERFDTVVEMNRWRISSSRARWGTPRRTIWAGRGGAV